MGRILVGTSGYVYRHWRRIFYPDDLPADRWLSFYSEVFSTVELNNTFYRLPTPAAVDGWARRSPVGFSFACKGSRYLTHVKRLKDTSGLDRFYPLVRRLGAKLGPVLWQLPPTMKPDLGRLEHFLAALPTGIGCVFEFRDERWYTDSVADLLDRYGVAFCEHDLVDRAIPRRTGGFRYLRFHGKTAKYRGRYGRRRLRPIAEDLIAWRRQGDAYVYFNNDLGGHAILDGLDLLHLLNASVDRRATKESKVLDVDRMA